MSYRMEFPLSAFSLPIPLHELNFTGVLSVLRFKPLLRVILGDEKLSDLM